LSVSLCVLIAINYLTVLSCIAIAGGFCAFAFGVSLRSRTQALLRPEASKIASAGVGLMEVTGKATGPHTMPSPITGTACFVYRVTAWQQNPANKKWDEVAQETLHLPFFIEDSTGQLMVEPLDAALELLTDFTEEYGTSLLRSAKIEPLPPLVSAFLSRHGVALAGPIRIEERLVKPGDPIVVAGTVTENPGIRLRPFTNDSVKHDADRTSRDELLKNAGSLELSELATPRVIRLASGNLPSESHQMGQQAKIAAALTRAGITKPEAWSAAGVPYTTIEPEADAASSAVSVHSQIGWDLLPDKTSNQLRLQDSQAEESPLTPPLVLMKAAEDPWFVISYRSQKESASALHRKSAMMMGSGVVIMLLGLVAILSRLWLR
jgi:E3 Ubiquitin ligase